MPRISYTSKKFQAKSLAIIELANSICRQYADAGYDLTLRQLYYQFIARDFFPNNQKSYNRLGSIVNDARMAGLMDWNYIVDRTRDYEELAHWSNPEEILAAVASQFRTKRWEDQPFYVEVWIEKDALVGILESVCPGLDVGYFSCRGYTSQSEMWTAAQRQREAIEAGHQVLILHLGDHDPSGIDMSRDIEERLRGFIFNDWYNSSWFGARPLGDSAYFSDIEKNMRTAINARREDFRFDVPEIGSSEKVFEVRRIALTMDQIEEFNPPPNFAKMTDSRFEQYEAMYGSDSWELDALSPEVLTGLIREHVDGVRDDDIWQDTTDEMMAERRTMQEIADQYEDVKDFIENRGTDGA